MGSDSVQPSGVSVIHQQSSVPHAAATGAGQAVFGEAPGGDRAAASTPPGTALAPSGAAITSSGASPAAASEGGRPGPVRGRRNDGSISCMNCKTTTTPLWRRDPQTGAHLCNRCGLYLKTYNVMHPLTRTKRRASSAASTARKPDSGGAPEMDDVEQMPRPANCHPPQLQQLGEGARQRRVTPKQQICQGITPCCFNCGAETTPLWRRDPEDNIICNACGLYYKLHSKARPVSMRQAVIRRRNRVNAPAGSSSSSTSVPAAAGGSIAWGMRAAGAHMDGLSVLARAAELVPSKATPGGWAKAGRTGHTILESLASVATAEIAGSRQSHEQLQRECQQLEQQLAKSRAMLGAMQSAGQ
ncbi:GATA type transcriptional activator of nitrogen-regulated proteins [Coemansia biformis]|uniref:GATA type transcriptional activator of nitrogen-regulated proteins n=1 Tax=Coemansia biformis TaxID=1286918 RepID=A0A9W8CZE5_9FUNG|nr:GATA type transcriptional activator of nitrogen-regulated proteins [Coemansia biformis]